VPVAGRFILQLEFKKAETFEFIVIEGAYFAPNGAFGFN
jgi:hypothetical protein